MFKLDTGPMETTFILFRFNHRLQYLINIQLEQFLMAIKIHLYHWEHFAIMEQINSI